MLLRHLPLCHFHDLILATCAFLSLLCCTTPHLISVAHDFLLAFLVLFVVKMISMGSNSPSSHANLNHLSMSPCSPRLISYMNMPIMITIPIETLTRTCFNALSGCSPLWLTQKTSIFGEYLWKILLSDDLAVNHVTRRDISSSGWTQEGLSDTTLGCPLI